jgi:hypothetical protein
MAKDNSKSTDEKNQDGKSKRGRPASAKSEDGKKSESKKTNSLLEKTKKEDKPIAEPKPKLSEAEQLIKDIYGDEPLKDYIPFPKSEQKTQTTAIVAQYKIEVGKLPQDILNLVNDFASDFTNFTQNPMLFALIPNIQSKDAKASLALAEWIQSKNGKFEMLIQKSAGGISVVNSNTNTDNGGNKTVVDSKNINDVLKTMPQSTKDANAIQTAQNNVNPNPTAFNPIRQAEGGTYKHHIHSNPIQNNNINPNPLANQPQSPMTENKNIHYEILSKSNPYADAYKQQNYQSTQQPVVQVEPKQYLKDYLDSVMKNVTSAFQFIHWGYIPMDLLKDILSKCDKSMTYEIVKDDDSEYVYLRISNGTDNSESDKFKCQ